MHTCHLQLTTVFTYDEGSDSPMMKEAEANTLATKKTMPTEPPNSGPSALLIMTGEKRRVKGPKVQYIRYTCKLDQYNQIPESCPCIRIHEMLVVEVSLGNSS